MYKHGTRILNKENFEMWKAEYFMEYQNIDLKSNKETRHI
jgi:hypothetical protein